MSAASTALTLLVETAGYLRLHEMNHPHAGQLDPIFVPDKPVGYKTEVGFTASNSPGNLGFGPSPPPPDLSGGSVGCC